MSTVVLIGKKPLCPKASIIDQIILGFSAKFKNMMNEKWEK